MKQIAVEEEMQFKAFPYLCFFAVLSKIIYEQTLKYIGQEQLAEYFGINVPEKYDGSIINIHRTNDKNLWGVHLKIDDVNKYFANKSIQLHEEYIPIACMTDYEFIDNINHALLNANSVYCGYDYGLLNAKKETKVGHICQIIESYKEKENVSIFDPGPEGYGIKKIDSIELYSAIHSKKDGLSIIRRK